MTSLQHIESFVRSVEAGSFAAAARGLGITPAAVGKNVAKLEASLGLRLLQRTTRSLVLTEDGTRFLGNARDGLAQLNAAVDDARSAKGKPAGVLRVSLGTVFSRNYLMPILARYVAEHPAVTPELHFDNQHVDLVKAGFDVAIGGGFELPPGVVARRLAPAHRVLLAAPTFAARPRTPADLATLPGLLVRSPFTGRVHTLPLRNAAGEQAPLSLRPRLLVNEPDACCQAAVLGLGIALASMPQALPYLTSGSLVRVLPGWWIEAGQLSVYYPAQKLLPPKTRAFVDAVVDGFHAEGLAQKLDASRPSARR